MDERLRRPCGICGKRLDQHVVRACFGGYGTFWDPDGKPDPRLLPNAEPPKKTIVAANLLDGLGHMLFDTITDVLACPPGESYARRDVVLRIEGVEHKVSVLVCRPTTADQMDQFAQAEFNVRTISVKTDEAM